MHNQTDAASESATTGQILEIWRYPVKSMLGEKLEAAEITTRGLLGDRGYAMVDVETGRVVSAKNPRRWPNLFEFRSHYHVEPHTDLELPPARITFPDGSAISTEHPEIDQKLSASVGRQVRLTRVTEVPPGALGQGYWPDHEWLAEPDKTFDVDLAAGTFFDGAMFHLVTTASLEHLQALAPGSRFDVRRYRANLLIQTGEGLSGFVENGWIGKTFSIGEVVIRVDRPCPRCVMTTLPQGDIPKDPTVLRTVVQNNGGNVGVYATVLKAGRITSGDAVSPTLRFGH